MSVIYQPSGKALEYASLASNVYRGCDHGCRYCYAPAVLRMDKGSFAKPSLRKDFLKSFEKDCNGLGAGSEVHLCFTCDPYQKMDAQHQITREALKLLFSNGLKVRILTKGGNRSLRDLDLFMANRESVNYGATLVFTDESDRIKWEPFAAPTQERVECLKQIHDAGIKTWVSLEPVISTDQSLELIKQTFEFVDEYKIGKINHVAGFENVDWKSFTNEAIELLKLYGKKYLIKKDLQKYLN